MKYLTLTSSLLLLLPILIINNNQSQAKKTFKRENDPEYQRVYCDEKKLSWDFYCDEDQLVKQAEEKTKNKTKKQNNPQDQKTLTPYQEVLAIREKLQNLHAKSILEPTEKNIYQYEMFKLEQLNTVSTLTQATQRVYWKYPELNYSLKRPVESLGKRVWLDDRRKEIENNLYNLKNEYVLLYFFQSTCSICLKFSPLIKQLTDKYQIPIRAISLNGKSSKSFPNARVNKGEAKRLNITAVPTLLLFKRKNKEILPIGTGFIAIAELKERIYLLTKVKVGDDY